MMNHQQSIHGLAISLALFALAASAWCQDGPAIAGVPYEDIPVLSGSESAEVLELPPPPVSAEAPAVQLEGLVARRPAPRTVAMAPAANDALNGILSDVGQRAGGQQSLESMLYAQLRQAVPGGDACIFGQASLPSSLQLPASGWKARFDFRLPVRGVGRATYVARITDSKGSELERFTGSVVIDRETRGVTVRRVVRRGETLVEADLEPLTATLSKLPRGALDDPASIVGTVAQKEIRPGEWLTEQSVAMAEVVRRGQGVTLKLQRGPIQISTPGLAQQAGAIGQVIRVKNAQSGRELFARVLSKDEAQVVF